MIGFVIQGLLVPGGFVIQWLLVPIVFVIQGLPWLLVPGGFVIQGLLVPIGFVIQGLLVPFLGEVIFLHDDWSLTSSLNVISLSHSWLRNIVRPGGEFDSYWLGNPGKPVRSTDRQDKTKRKDVEISVNPKQSNKKKNNKETYEINKQKR